MAELQGLKLNDKLKQVYDKALSLGLRFTSGYRPGSTGPSGRPDSHSQGMAMDFAGSKDKMDEFAKWAKIKRRLDKAIADLEKSSEPSNRCQKRHRCKEG